MLMYYERVFFPGSIGVPVGSKQMRRPISATRRPGASKYMQLTIRYPSGGSLASRELRSASNPPA